MAILDSPLIRNLCRFSVTLPATPEPSTHDSNSRTTYLAVLLNDYTTRLYTRLRGKVLFRVVGGSDLASVCSQATVIRITRTVESFIMIFCLHLKVPHLRDKFSDMYPGLREIK